MRGSSTEPLLFKGIQDIHDALNLLAKRHPNFTAVRISGSPPEIFQRFPCEFYIAPSDEMKTVLFGTADILIYASHYDSCPRPPQEGMASGCAVVCTATPGAMEYCRDGENCLLVPIQSPQAIADATLRLIQDRALREQLVRGGLATAREYPRELEWNELETMLQRFVEEAKKAPAPEPANQAHPLGQQPQQAKAAAGKPITLPEVAFQGDLLEAQNALRDKDLARAWRLGCEAIVQRPFHPEGWVFLSGVAASAGHRSMARRCAQRAVAQTPNWKPAKRALSGIGDRPDKPTVDLAEPPFRDGEPPRLTVCLIARNEERFLDGCLKSVRGLADQIVLVDTGSTDRTVDIARSHGAEVHFRAWDDDFSAARNAALLHARGDWVLILDADEEVSPAHHQALRAMLERPNVIAYRLPLVDVGREGEGVSQVPRLFRNAPRQFYVSRVHEQVYASLEINREAWSMENRFGDAQLIHHGYQAEVVKSRNKVVRNLRLLELANEEHPNDVNLLMNLGLELWRSGQNGIGLGYYQRAYVAMLGHPFNQTPPELREVLLTQYTSHLMTLKRFDDVIALFNERAIRTEQRTASHWFMLGLAQSALHQWEACVESMRQCLALRHQTALTPIHSDIRKAIPSHCLAHALRKLGRKQEAADAYAQALQDEPGCESARVEFGTFIAEEGQVVPALTVLHQGIQHDPRQGRVWEAGGAIALRQRDTLEFALDWTAEALKNLPDHPALRRQRAETLLLHGMAREALPLWDEAPAGSSGPSGQAQDPATACGLLLCRLFAGEPLPGPSTDRERALSQDLIRRYRQAVELGLDDWVRGLHERIDALETVLPTAARLIRQVVAESGPDQA
ncbi:MAG: glycosyltransferase [Verrucomicrobium sp.]|nr:glycosyltransferase [Verrucomicrobium sp.]